MAIHALVLQTDVRSTTYLDAVAIVIRILSVLMACSVIKKVQRCGHQDVQAHIRILPAEISVMTLKYTSRHFSMRLTIRWKLWIVFSVSVLQWKNRLVLPTPFP
jgi:hypothetical protein